MTNGQKRFVEDGKGLKGNNKNVKKGVKSLADHMEKRRKNEMADNKKQTEMERTQRWNQPMGVVKPAPKKEKDKTNAKDEEKK